MTKETKKSTDNEPGIISVPKNDSPQKKSKTDKINIKSAKERNELIKMAENIVSLYDSSISAASSILNELYSIMNSAEYENGEMKEKLKEFLAKKLNLRKKDFDSFFSELLYGGSDIEKAEIKKKIDELLHEHKNSVELLKEKIIDRKKIRSEEVKDLFFKIQRRQKERENEVKQMISDFQMQHRVMIKTLQDFLEEDRNMRVKDLKKLMNKFQKDREQRIKENIERAKRWRKQTTEN